MLTLWIGTLKRLWYIALPVGLLLALGLFFFSRWGIKNFFRTTLALEDTSLSVKEIRELGQLITAEYYGELIYSLEDTKREALEAEMQAAYLAARPFFESQYFTLLNQEVPSNPQDQNRLYRRIFREFEANPTTQKAANSRGFALLRQVVPREAPLTEALLRQSWEQFFAAQTEAMDEVIADQLANRNLTYLARGWVKAGLDLSQLDSTDFRIDETDPQLLRLDNLDPQILDVDINPWLIPPGRYHRSGIMGFELLSAGTNMRRTHFEDMTLLKAACKEQLIEAALVRQILEEAEASGAETLLNFFNLVRPIDQLPYDSVAIQHTPLYDSTGVFLADGALIADELPRLLRIWQDPTNARSDLVAFHHRLSARADSLTPEWYGFSEELGEVMEKREGR